MATLLLGSLLISAVFPSLVSASEVSTYTNPILPGWHSDPSCVFVPSMDNTFFCTTSSFMSFPGNPVYASQDLIHWTLASNSVTRAAQFPEIRTATNQQFGGVFANTLRFHDGKFYLISAWYNGDIGQPRFVMNTATDPYDDESWSDVMFIETPGRTIDPDIFFDDDGSVVVVSAGMPIIACYLNVTTGEMSDPWTTWNGTGGDHAEGPHLYKKDGWYYMLLAEGGTQIGHAATMARSRTLNGTWESSPVNPLVSNARTNEYFQTVGHADLFQDADQNWWGVALTTRGGPALYNASHFPMGRETALFPVSWPEGEWPTASQVRGQMTGPLPRSKPKPFSKSDIVVGSADSVDFKPGSKFPEHWIHWRAPFDESYYQISPKGHGNTLQLTSSRANLTADAAFNASHEGLTGIFRRQEHTFFNYTVDLHLGFAQSDGDELGVSNFLNQDQHVDIGIVYMEKDGSLQPSFRFRSNSVRAKMPEPIITAVPKTWLNDKAIRIRISPTDEAKYNFFAAPASKPKEEKLIASYSTALLSGDGAGTGGLFGVYATTNGGNHTFNGYVSRWRYTPVAQKIDYNKIIRV